MRTFPSRRRCLLARRRRPSARQRRRLTRRHLLALAVSVTMAAGLLAAVLATAGATTTTTYYPVLRFGSNGSNDGQFGSSSPDGIAVDLAGDIYCTDPGRNRVEKFTPAGAFVCLIGSTDGLNAPFGVTVAADGTVFVMDSLNNRVRRYTPNGDATAYSVAGGWSIPSFSGRYAHGICTDVGSSGHVFVADGPNNEVLEYDGSNGTLLHTIGSGPGSGTSQFSNPEDVAAVWNGGTFDLYVADSGNTRVTKWHYDGVSWAYSATVVSGPSICNTPAGVDVDLSGNVYFTDSSNFYVHRYDLSGGSYSLAATYGTGSPVNRGDTGFFWPWGIAVSPNGVTVCVGDTDFEVHKLGLDTTAPTTTAVPSPTPNGIGWNNTTPVTVTLTPADTGGSGVPAGNTWYCLHGASWTPYSAPFTDTAEGTSVYDFYSKDAAGNQEVAKSITVEIDTIKPIVGG